MFYLIIQWFCYFYFVFEFIQAPGEMLYDSMKKISMIVIFLDRMIIEIEDLRNVYSIFCSWTVIKCEPRGTWVMYAFFFFFFIKLLIS